jgi:outer membrane protein OmpA-like peptidoglycan-associated protein
MGIGAAGLACPALRAQPTGVPLIAGLAVTTAVHVPGAGDYESVKTLAARHGSGWRIEYRAQQPAPQAASRARPVASVRLQSDADLQNATVYRAGFEEGSEEDYPGSTALGTSAQVLAALRGSGSSPFRLVDALDNLAPPGAGAPALAAVLTGGAVDLRGELQRTAVGTRPVLVNGPRIDLPVLVARGDLRARGGQAVACRLDFLADERNPLALAWQVGPARLVVVRIDWPQRADAVAADLAQRRRIVLPGLYFDFGTAALQPRSAGALQTIVQAVQRNPGALLLEGHTDALGNAAANLALSLARAQAVRSALVALDAGLAGRTSIDGQGAARPVADNATLEGRAQNRRVELVLR